MKVEIGQNKFTLESEASRVRIQVAKPVSLETLWHIELESDYTNEKFWMSFKLTESETHMLIQRLRALLSSRSLFRKLKFWLQLKWFNFRFNFCQPCIVWPVRMKLQKLLMNHPGHTRDAEAETQLDRWKPRW